MHKEKGKKKMPEYGIDKEESDRSQSETGRNEGGPSAMKSKAGDSEATLIYPSEEPCDTVRVQ